MPETIYTDYFARRVYSRDEQPQFAVLTPERGQTKFRLSINRSRWTGHRQTAAFSVRMKWSTDRGQSWREKQILLVPAGEVDKDIPDSLPQEKATTIDFVSPMPEGTNRIRFPIHMREEADFNGDVILF